VSGVVSHPDGLIQSEVLTTTFPLDADWRDDAMQQALAKCAGALNNAFTRLSTYYKELKTASTSPESTEYSKSHFPYQCSYHSRGTETISFKYIDRPFEDRLVFIGEEETGRQVLIKFTRTYCHEAHEELMSVNSAPVLYGFQLLPGGWIMVVMEYLHEEEWTMLYDIPLQQREKFRPAIKAAVVHLHGKGYVHGDIRVGNVFVHRKSAAVKLLDFDEAGRVGIAKYPANLNTTSVVRPSGASDGKPITEEHDRFMVGYLFTTEYSGRCLERSITIPQVQE
jgi:hypothetical protein